MSTETSLKDAAQALADLQVKYPDKFRYFVKDAKKIEGEKDEENCCMVTLPCSNAGKRLGVLITEI